MPSIQMTPEWLGKLTLIFVILSGLYFLFIFIIRNRHTRMSAAFAERKKVLGPMISTFLFYEDDATRSEKTDYVGLKLEIRQLLKDQFNRKVLVEIFLDLKKDISGEANLVLSQLYRNLGLHLYAFDALKSRRWVKISTGIQELNELHVEEGYGFIKPFINHRRGIIRKQAQLAIVSLKHEGICYFLDSNKYPISEWQQLKLMDVLRNLKDFQPPRFRRWLTSKNKYVVLFALRLLKHYKQNDANASLIELVKHRNDQIKTEAIDCIREFCVFDALDIMKAVFWKYSPEIKILLLDTIANLGTEKDIPFLKNVENKEISFIVKSKAISAINQILPGTILPTIGIEAHEPYCGELPLSSNDRNNTEAEINGDTDKVIPETANGQVALNAEEEVFAPEIGLTGYPVSVEGPLPYTYGWEELLDTETDDEVIFDLCLMEELEDILAQKESSEEEEAGVGILPLDFLPVVTEAEQPIEEYLWSHSLPLSILELETACEIVSEEENFSMELNRILQSIGSPSEEEVLTALKPGPSTEKYIAGEPGLSANTQSGGNESGAIHDSVQLPTDGIRAEEEKTPPSDVCDSDNDTADIIFHLEPLNGSAMAGSSPRPQEAPTTTQRDYGMQSIFYDFFRNADEESKLILLDEVFAVGDSKDLCFLDSLEGDASRKVRIKAARIRVNLPKKWAGESGTDSQSPAFRSAFGRTGGKNGRLINGIVIRPETLFKNLQPLEYCFLDINGSFHDAGECRSNTPIKSSPNASGTNQQQMD